MREGYTPPEEVVAYAPKPVRVRVRGAARRLSARARHRRQCACVPAGDGGQVDRPPSGHGPRSCSCACEGPRRHCGVLERARFTRVPPRCCRPCAFPSPLVCVGGCAHRQRCCTEECAAAREAGCGTKGPEFPRRFGACVVLRCCCRVGAPRCLTCASTLSFSRLQAAEEEKLAERLASATIQDPPA